MFVHIISTFLHMNATFSAHCVNAFRAFYFEDASTNFAFLDCDIGGVILIAALTNHAVLELGIEEGDDIFLIIKATSINPMESL